MAEGGYGFQHDKVERGRDEPCKDINITGITGGNAQNVVAAGFIQGNVSIGREEYLQDLEDQTHEEIQLWIEGMIRIAAVDKVIETIHAGHQWITITGNPGEGKTTLGYMVLNMLQKEGQRVFKLDTPEDYIHAVRKNRNCAIMLNDILGAFMFDSYALSKWQSVIHSIIDGQEKSQNPRDQPVVLFIGRRNVLEAAKDHLGGYGEFILHQTRVIDLSNTEVIQERFDILEYYLKGTRVHISDYKKQSVVFGKNPHGFPHCCKIFVQLVLKEKIDIVEFFSSPLQFLDQTTKVLSTSSNIMSLFQAMITSDGQFDVTSVRDGQKRAEMQSTVLELTGSFLKRRLGIVLFSHPSIYESVISVIGQKDPMFVLQNASISVLKQKVNIKTNDKDTLYGFVNVDPLPNIIQILQERFRLQILEKDFSVFENQRLCGNVEFCRSLVTASTRKMNIPFGVFQKNQKLYIDTRDHTGRTMFHTAIEAANYSAVGVLLEHGADVNKQWIVDRTDPGHMLWFKGLARLEHQMHVVLCYNKRYSERLNTSSSQLTAVHQINEMKSKCSKNVTVDKEDGDKDNTDTCVVADGAAAATTTTTDDDDDQFGSISEYSQPLERERRIFTDNGDNEIENGTYEQTALYCLCSQPQPDVSALELLINHRADVNKACRFKQTALHRLCRHNHPNISVVEVLLKNGACVNKVDCHGQTPLHYLCCNDEQDVNTIEFLLKNGAAVNIADSKGYTPLCYLHSHKERLLWRLSQLSPSTRATYAAIELLIKSGADVNKVKSNVPTEMHNLSDHIKRFLYALELLTSDDATVEKNCRWGPDQR